MANNQRSLAKTPVSSKSRYRRASRRRLLTANICESQPPFPPPFFVLLLYSFWGVVVDKIGG